MSCRFCQPAGHSRICGDIVGFSNSRECYKISRICGVIRVEILDFFRPVVILSCLVIRVNIIKFLGSVDILSGLVIRVDFLGCVETLLVLVTFNFSR